MWLINLIALLILFFSFIGGLKDGAVKAFFSLVALLIAIPLAGLFYHWLAGLLAFLPGENWPNFLGFFITLGVISIILHLIFLLPRKLLQKALPQGVLLRLIGGILNTLGAAIGLVVFSLVIVAYPVWGWLEQAIVNSSVPVWLVSHLGFVQMLMPEIFRLGGQIMTLGL